MINLPPAPTYIHQHPLTPHLPKPPLAARKTTKRQPKHHHYHHHEAHHHRAHQNGKLPSTHPRPPFLNQPPTMPFNPVNTTLHPCLNAPHPNLAPRSPLRHRSAPHPPRPAQQGTWRRLERRIRGKIWTGKASGGELGNGIGNGNWGVMEEEREETRMYELTEKERGVGRMVVEECSWEVEREETEGSAGREKRRGDEKEERLERAAELLGRQGKVGVEVSDEVEDEVVEERRVAV
ncbi:hypothetical protein GMDG_02042 [Pseudogymnoascus destructans 20631-21]|uniref:Uncharacterized protein n=1 Tax=Pseudogymnoascus destructans (strain ATCC MYA-4855 / 20631-21) TaxID=658429 RepID=L8FZG3_PSED2|nr:hypothetical protein GMDG_02042 [Pseudogymnoascus destructans 20631-21]